MSEDDADEIAEVVDLFLELTDDYTVADRMALFSKAMCEVAKAAGLTKDEFLKGMAISFDIVEGPRDGITH